MEHDGKGRDSCRSFRSNRVAIDARFFRYVVAATAGLVILKGPQDHLSRTKPLEADLAALRKEASLLHE